MNPVYRSLFWKRTLASLISLDQWRKQKNIRVSACVCYIRLNEKSCNPRAVLKIKDVLEFDGLRDLCGKGSPQGSFEGKTQTSRRNSVFEYLEIRRGTVPSSGFNFTRSRRNGHQKGIGIVKRYVIHHLIASRGVTERMNYFYYSFFGPPFDSCVSVFYYYYFFFVRSFHANNNGCCCVRANTRFPRRNGEKPTRRTTVTVHPRFVVTSQFSENDNPAWSREIADFKSHPRPYIIIFTGLLSVPRYRWHFSFPSLLFRCTNIGQTERERVFFLILLCLGVFFFVGVLLFWGADNTKYDGRKTQQYHIFIIHGFLCFFARRTNK